MIRGRLAPSPTGALHLGNAKTFLLAWLSIRAQGGSVLMRIEDLDGPRVKPEAVQSVIDDLCWLGLNWDEGPDCGGLHSPYVQTARANLYQAAIARLQTEQLIYPCVCSRSDIEQAASAPHLGEEGPRYPGTCCGRFVNEAEAKLASGRDPSLRFRVPSEAVEFNDQLLGKITTNVAEQVGDFVIRKGNGTAAYQLAVVVDDAAMGVTEVVRGDDLLSSTPRQLLLYEALQLTAPQFLHVPLVVGPDGLRLAKRHGDTRVSEFRRTGIPPERLVGLLASWSGLVAAGAECLPNDLIQRFDWDRVSRERVVCDRNQVDRLLRSGH